MDFGVVGSEGSETAATATSTGFPFVASGSETKHKLYGSGFLKQERSGNGEDDCWVSKVAKFDDVSASKGMLPQQRNTSSRSNNTSIFFDGQQHHQMLSFSTPKSEALSMERSSQNFTFPYNHFTSPAYSKHTGYYSEGFSGANMTGGPFTPSQWMELEHQALIYKYITANVPVPSNLLIPITKALDSAGFSCFSGGFLRPNTLGWGAFNLGFSNNSDPEPGRCRRTDGKKWRCSRDAVADQKYCERHMNRGRHRSRKPVEGQSGHAATGATKMMHHTVSPSSASVVGPTGGSSASNSKANAQQQFKKLLPAGKSNISESALINRLLLNKETIVERTHDTAPGNEFGVVSSESLLNPSHNSPSLVKCIDFGCSQNLNSQETESHRSVHQFNDGWPRTQCDRSSVDVQSDRTRLSISIPLGVGSSFGNETNRRQATWIPISCETSMGGPLGEALHSTNSNSTDCNNSSALNLMTESWDHSPQFGSSPTGVLQKTTFVSQSNSSAGSSPRAENNKNDLLGSTIARS